MKHQVLLQDYQNLKKDFEQLPTSCHGERIPRPTALLPPHMYQSEKGPPQTTVAIAERHKQGNQKSLQCFRLKIIHILTF